MQVLLIREQTARGSLYMVREGAEADQKIYWASFDGSSWTQQQVVRDMKTSSKPALAIYFL